MSESLPRIAGPSASSRVEPLYSRIASTLARRTVAVKCWNQIDWNALHQQFVQYEAPRGGTDTAGLSNVLGYVKSEDRGTVNLAPDVCARLDLLTYGHKRPKAPGAMFDIARAVVTLAHESVHTTGVDDEAVTECYGMQYVAQAARMLGLTPWYGRTLANVIWTQDWPRWEGTPYWTADCYDGGPLDLRPGSSVWP